MQFRVQTTSQTDAEVLAIRDVRVRRTIISRMMALAKEPEMQGKPLSGPLAGYRSVRAVGQRYRIVYRIDQGKVTVVVVMVGIRREGSREDVYRLAEKMVRLGFIQPKEK